MNLDPVKIVDALLEISEWPWKHDDGEIITGGAVLAQVIGADDLPCLDEDDRKVDAELKANAIFIASSPVWLASLVVALVEEKANHLCWINGKYGPLVEFIPTSLRSFNLDPAKYAELKKRLENVKPEGK